MAVKKSDLTGILDAAQGSAAKATGTITLSVAVPADGTKVTVNGVDFTFKTVAVSANHVLIGADIGATAAELQAVLEASIDENVSVASYTVSGAVVTITYVTAGTVGNAFTLAKTGTNIAVSGAVLTGGTNTGGNVYNSDKTTGGGIDAAKINSDYENSVVAMIAAVEFVLTSTIDPTLSDAYNGLARQQRKLLKDTLNKLSMAVSTVANSDVDDRSTVAGVVRDKAIAFYNNNNVSADL